MKKSAKNGEKSQNFKFDKAVFEVFPKFIGHLDALGLRQNFHPKFSPPLSTMSDFEESDSSLAEPTLSECQETTEKKAG
jgi:hypothetical protein